METVRIPRRSNVGPTIASHTPVSLTLDRVSSLAPAGGVLRETVAGPHHAQRFADGKYILDGAQRSVRCRRLVVRVALPVTLQK